MLLGGQSQNRVGGGILPGWQSVPQGGRMLPNPQTSVIIPHPNM